MRRPALRLAATLAALALAVACDRPPRAPAAVTQADVRKLRWIEGSWRGTGGDQGISYERYGFADDSTLRIDGFADSTLSTVRDSTRFELRGGRFGNAGRSVRGWVAAHLDDRSVTFVLVPATGSRSALTWRYGSPDRWTAVEHWRGRGSRSTRTATYTMERMR